MRDVTMNKWIVVSDDALNINTRIADWIITGTSGNASLYAKMANTVVPAPRAASPINGHMGAVESLPLPLVRCLACCLNLYATKVERLTVASPMITIDKVIISIIFPGDFLF